MDKWIFRSMICLGITLLFLRQWYPVALHGSHLNVCMCDEGKSLYDMRLRSFLFSLRRRGDLPFGDVSTLDSWDLKSGRFIVF